MAGSEDIPCTEEDLDAVDVVEDLDAVDAVEDVVAEGAVDTRLS